MTIVDCVGSARKWASWSIAICGAGRKAKIASRMARIKIVEVTMSRTMELSQLQLWLKSSDKLGNGGVRALRL